MRIVQFLLELTTAAIIGLCMAYVLRYSPVLP